MHRLAFSFVLGYHGCDRAEAEKRLEGVPFKASTNVYDWLGTGIYFWEANPRRGLEFAEEAAGRRGSKIKTPYVIGAILDLGLCLDLTTSVGVATVKRGYVSLRRSLSESGGQIPENSTDLLRRNLDCAVINRVHEIQKDSGLPGFDSVRGVFTEGARAYPGAGIYEKTHIQIAIRNPECIKGVFRVPDPHLN